ncbi:hypothetical protein [Flagellimonas lutaonensis]|uniref:Uncharacterized protein n=1 Tax=Flagellimonas lutaonensis TaxID=516051 RepID=A0A0D5YWI7_9FLAO|nr:hypothetical protein [Allomuricauda lutaonensis]AKA36223.1 hypothetical protein VC82_2662 [Allomuricauda lutaonensis]
MSSILKRAFLGFLAGLLAGTLVLGIGGRLAMRGIALMGGLKGGFSWGGTMEVVLLGLIIGAISGTIYGVLSNYLFKNKWSAGGLYGLLAFVAILVLPIEGKGAAKGFPDLQVPISLIFGGLHVVYGVVLAFLFGRMNRTE